MTLYRDRSRVSYRWFTLRLEGRPCRLLRKQIPPRATLTAGPLNVNASRFGSGLSIVSAIAEQSIQPGVIIRPAPLPRSRSLPAASSL